MKRKTTTGGIAAQILAETPNLPIDQLVPEIIKRHTAQGCEFFDERSGLRALANYRSEGEPGLERLYDFLDYEESFCPHEGIDKRPPSSDHAQSNGLLDL